MDDDASLAEISDRLQRAEFAGYAESQANCCYAKSNKYWTRDPANIPWENFHTLGQIPVFGEDVQTEEEHKNDPVSSADTGGVRANGRCCS